MLNHVGPFKDSRSNSAHPHCSSRWRQLLAGILRPFRWFPERRVFAFIHQPSEMPRLDRGWIIANHKLVSFHAAFLTSLLSIPLHVASKFDVMRQMFLSVEVVISSLMWYAAWHSNIAIHEMGHYLAAVKTNNLRPELAGPAEQKLKQGLLGRWLWYLEMFVKIPYGAFQGVHKEAGSFHPGVKTQNLAVSAAGPRASKVLSQITFLPGIVLILLGLYTTFPAAVYAGRASVHHWRGRPLRLPALGRGKIQGVPGKAARGGGKNGGSEGRGTGPCDARSAPGKAV